MMTQTASQLANRPAYEHCASFDDALTKANAVRETSRELVVAPEQISYELAEDGDERRLVVKVGTPRGEKVFEATNYLMGQIGSHTGVNLKLVKHLTPETLTSALRETWKPGETLPKEIKLLHTDTKLRAFTGTGYTRLWDAEILEALDRWLVGSGGWMAAEPTINQSWATRNPDGSMKPAMFLGDRSSHFFMYSKERDDGNGGMRTGLITNNSEVGAKSFTFSHFLFMEMCANFLIWSPKQLRTQIYKHTRNTLRHGWAAYNRLLQELSNEVNPLVMETLEAAKGQIFQRVVTPSRDEQVKARELKMDPEIFARDEAAARKIAGKTSLTLTQARRGMVASKRDHNHLGEDPYSIFGVVQGITDAAKGEKFQDAMVDMSEAGSRLLDLVTV